MAIVRLAIVPLASLYVIAIVFGLLANWTGLAKRPGLWGCIARFCRALMLLSP